MVGKSAESSALCRACFLLALLATCFLYPARGFATDAQSLHEALNRAIKETRPNFPERLELVERVKAFLAEAPEGDLLLGQKAHLLFALTQMRLGHFDESTAVTQRLCPELDWSELPDLRMHCDVLAASLLMIAGQRAESLSEFKAIFARDLSAVSPALVKRFRLSYAIVLNENGRSAQAVDMYEEALLEALSAEDDAHTLMAGNNLIVILIAQKDYEAARQTLERLRPAMERTPNTMLNGSLMLHDLELLRIEGEAAAAIAGLNRFIKDGVDDTPLMMGSAHKIIADAYRQVGLLEQAAIHAQSAVELLADQAHELTDAKLALAKVLIEQRALDEATALLQSIDLAAEGVPSRRVSIHELLLKAQLLQGNRAEEVRLFEALISSDAQRDQLTATTRAEYMSARLDAVQQGQELELAKAEMAAQEQQRQIERRNGRLVVTLVVLTALGICLLVYTLLRRKVERERRSEQARQTQRLESLVAEKTEALTQNLKVQAEITKALEQSRRIEAVGMLAGNVAHDFNNLLQVIASSNETLAKADANAEERAQMLALADDAVDHAAKIVHQLLAFARQQDLTSSSFQFSEFLDENRALLKSAIGAENRLRIEDVSHQASIAVDSAQLVTSLLNLLRNSADAMPEGGEASLIVRRLALDSEAAGYWDDVEAGDYLSIAVSDTGIGMNDEQIARAFEPFFTTKDIASGTGLGLSSVHGFVKQSGGDLRLRSVSGEGTKIEILLPISTQDQLEPASQPEPASVSLEGKRLLLVEDNESVARMLSEMLRSIGVEVVLAASGEAGQRLLQEDNGFDLLLTDVRMPGQLNGPQLVDWVRAERPGIAVLLMSGFTDQTTEYVDVPLIQKPFTLADLSALLRRQLSASTA